MHYVWSGQLLKCTSRCVSTNSAIVMMATAVSPKFKQELREKLESFRFKIFWVCVYVCVCSVGYLLSAFFSDHDLNYACLFFVWVQTLQMKWDSLFEIMLKHHRLLVDMWASQHSNNHVQSRHSLTLSSSFLQDVQRCCSEVSILSGGARVGWALAFPCLFSPALYHNC